jgi:hypothetical protein
MLCLLGMLQPGVGHAQTLLEDSWLGMWCDAHGRFAVINHGVDPDTILREARAQIPLARKLLPADTRLMPPPRSGTCFVPSVGPVRVTTVVPPWKWMSRGGYAYPCRAFALAAWVGNRRVLGMTDAFACNVYGLIITPTMAFDCDVRREQPAGYQRPRCDVLGPSRAIGQHDRSLYPPSRNGLALRFGDPARCMSFIDWPMASGDWPAFTVQSGRLVLAGGRNLWSLADRRLTKVEWREMVGGGDWAQAHSAAFDFLGRGKPDAVFRVTFILTYYRHQFDGVVYFVVPGQGEAVDDIARLLRESFGPRHWGNAVHLREDILRRLRAIHEVIVVDATGIADHTEPSELIVVRDDNTTWTVMQRAGLWDRERNALVLSRVEKDGRQTPLCMYDRTWPPPFAPM